MDMDKIAQEAVVVGSIEGEAALEMIALIRKQEAALRQSQAAYGELAMELAAAKLALVQPFMYAIMGPDGSAHIDEGCVASSEDQLSLEVNGLNESPDTGYTIVPVFTAAPAPATPAASVDAAITEEMLNAARDWSVKKYGIGIGNDAAIGCWTAMAAAAPQQHAQAALSDFEDAKGRRWRFGLRAEDAKCDLNPYGRNIVAQAMLDKGDSVSVDTSTGLHYFKSATEIVLRPIFPASQQPAAAPAPVKQANAGPSMGDMPSDRLIKSLPLTVFAPSPVQREVKS